MVGSIGPRILLWLLWVFSIPYLI